MWLVVLFDLPVGTKKERKAASGFRLKLLDLGFEMSQFSVYLRFCAGKEQAEAYERKIEQFMPASGKIHIMAITDKQYENIRTYRGRKREQSPENRISSSYSEEFTLIAPSRIKEKGPVSRALIRLGV